MDLSVLIVVLHYRGLDDTLECLASLERQTYRNFHMIVVDNGSVEKPGAILTAQYPRVEVLELPENRGWSGGNNAGIKLAIERNYDVVCLLNNDTVLPEHAIDRLMQAATYLEPCIFHPAIDSYGDDNEVQLDPTIPQPPELEGAPLPNHPGLFEINVVNGACLLAHVVVFKKIGLIDDRFFLLCEDADIGARAKEAGYRFFCDTRVRIQHKESRSFGGRRRPIKSYYGLRNRLLIWEKHEKTSITSRAWWSSLAWMISGNAEASGAKPQTHWELIRWCCSSDMFARAIRMGLRDYLFRRFGRLNKKDEAILMAGE